MSPLAWFALFLLLAAGLVVSAFLLGRVLRRRRRRRCAVPVADEGTDPAPDPLPSTSLWQEPVTSIAPSKAEEGPAQPIARAPALDSPFPSKPSDGEATATADDSPVAAAAILPQTGAFSEAAEPTPLATASDAVAPEADAAESGDADGTEFTFVTDQDAMRITKRSSGGRGEYEISEALGRITPRDLLNRVLILDLGEGLRIPSGVLLLDRNGNALSGPRRECLGDG
jgi:hypothetical protein